MKVLIGLSWPYANGRLHIGHVASSLPADALARFHRQIGNDVSFVTGSDCYGTPILVQAAKEGITPTALAEKYHAFHDTDFKKLGFTFDNYDKTLSARHHKFVKKFHEEMYKGDYIFEETSPQLFCEKCNQFLPDRYVEGICPFCKKPAKGDSCDSCGKILEPEDLIDPKCKLCGRAPVSKNQTQLYIKLSALQQKIQKFFDERKDTWSTNAQGMTQRYLNEGLHDRAITRSLTWGIDIPKSGWDDRKIYIWAENVLGYLSATEPEFILEDESECCSLDNSGFLRNDKKPIYQKSDACADFCYRGAEKLHYYVHGKDNIPFHGIILPGLLMAHGNGTPKYHLPDVIVASEYVTVGGEKLSKSRGNQIFAHTLYENFDVDVVRYFFLRTTNDKRDSNFTLDEFVNIINGELVNNFGNLVNRTLTFIQNKFNGEIPENKNIAIGKLLYDYKTNYQKLMYEGKISTALKAAMEVVNYGNKFFADKKPWINNDRDAIATTVEIIKCAVELLLPFIPNACSKVKKWLASNKLGEIEVLWQRLEIARVKEIFGVQSGKK
jgi:methionyl-tRNA synthetase